MRKLTVVLGLAALSVAAAVMVVGVAERDAEAQHGLAAPQKSLRIVGTNATNVKVDSTAGLITGVTLKGRAGGSYTLTVEAIAGHCSIAFPTANDAAQMAARVIDAKTTLVWCDGAVVTVPGSFIPRNSIDAATEIAVTSAP